MVCLCFALYVIFSDFDVGYSFLKSVILTSDKCLLQLVTQWQSYFTPIFYCEWCSNSSIFVTAKSIFVMCVHENVTSHILNYNTVVSGYILPMKTFSLVSNYWLSFKLQNTLSNESLFFRDDLTKVGSCFVRVDMASCLKYWIQLLIIQLVIFQKCCHLCPLILLTSMIRSSFHHFPWITVLPGQTLLFVTHLTAT